MLMLLAHVGAVALPRPVKIWLMRATMKPPAIYGGSVEPIAQPEILDNPFRFED